MNWVDLFVENDIDRENDFEWFDLEIAEAGGLEIQA